MTTISSFVANEREDGEEPYATAIWPYDDAVKDSVKKDLKIGGMVWYTFPANSDFGCRDGYGFDAAIWLWYEYGDT